MSPFIGFFVIVALDFSVGFWWDHCRCSARIKVLQQPIRIKRFVREERVKRNILDQRRYAFHVMGLAGQKQELHQIAKRIDQRHDLGCQPAARAPYGLSLSPPFAPVAF